MTNLDFGGFVLGGNVFGWTADQDTSFRILDAYLDAGGRAIDTADSYSVWVPGNSGGESETIIGNWLASRGRRDDITLATKVAMDPNRHGLSPSNIKTTVEESLRRLQTETIDLYYAHRDDPDVPQEDYLAALDSLVKEGKVRELGASAFSGERLGSAVRIARDNGLTPFTVSQDKYNLVERGAEEEALPVINELGLVEVPYVSPRIGLPDGQVPARRGGLLTARWGRGRVPGGSAERRTVGRARRRGVHPFRVRHRDLAGLAAFTPRRPGSLGLGTNAGTAGVPVRVGVGFPVS
jgi:aryl-alcohol dehydrogenase-like predicted oxidoreductase